MQPKTRERVITLAGGHNFRDLGGYPTRDGRTTAWGRVFRSGSMANLSDNDHVRLHDLGLSLVFDLRSTRERTNKPSRFPAERSFEIWARDHATSAADVLHAIRSPQASAEFTYTQMLSLYREIAYEQAESYKELFRRFAKGHVPIVFHCAAGKDRTGTAAALLLEVLGVPRDIIVEDYTYTNNFFDTLCEMATTDPTITSLTEADPVIWMPLMRAEPEYITTMLDTIEARHGSAAGFLRDELGLNDQDIAAIRNNLLI